MTVGHGFLATGGQSSQLKVSRLSDGLTVFDQMLGGLVNNGLHISRHSGEIRLLVSNNDQTVKSFELPSMRIMDSVRCSTSINCSSVSPDGNWMVAAGDSLDIFLFLVTKDGYVLYATVQGGSDSGMSCAWNSSSTQFAVASQDGLVSVWDLRFLEPLALLESKQDSHAKGACRCVKFCPSSAIDLLVFTEHTNYAHVVDTRDFSRVQTVALCSFDRNVNLSGACFSPDSTRLYISTEHSIREYLVDSSGRRTFGDPSLC
uniref:DUF2415 domain-containing protein n=2 Tax=Compsopogon caeruleus TaxID=31354 RepID=A0A7S1TCY8_9RHOD|mmetsp:Transcript_18053/g.37479  ORF Transcript_18053/g.37479 Transcript_18053/m.37479 type:complete len:260 (+) Transcript_18053:231-1010(+)